MPRFSIVTVCWNSEQVLPGAMRSLAAQTCRDYEWVVIDGASTDRTLDLVRSFDAAPAVVVSEKDAGIYDAMNKGVARAGGDYVFFLNSDDALYDENVLARVAAELDAAPDTDLLYGSVVYERTDGRVLRTFAHIDGTSLPFEDLCHQAVFARRSLFSRVGGFDCRFRLNADYDWLLRVFRSGAHTRCIDLRVARFTVGGAHVQNPLKLAQERKLVRLQYMSPARLFAGDIARRLRHRWHRHFRSHPLGQIALDE